MSNHQSTANRLDTCSDIHADQIYLFARNRFCPLVDFHNKTRAFVQFMLNAHTALNLPFIIAFKEHVTPKLKYTNY